MPRHLSTTPKWAGGASRAGSRRRSKRAETVYNVISGFGKQSEGMEGWRAGKINKGTAVLTELDTNLLNCDGGKNQPQKR